MLADLGTAEDGRLRFGNEQAGLLDALLAAQPEIRCDAAFTKVREQLHQLRGGRAARRAGRASTASSAPISARASAGSTTSRSSTSAASSPTTWAWARRSRCWRCLQQPPCAAAGQGALAGRRPPLARLQLDPGGRQVHPPAEGARLHRPGPPRPPRRRSATTTCRHDLRDPPHRHRGADRVRVRLRDPRRGAGDQERRQPGRQGRPPAPRPAPPGDERHADREPPGRALVDLRVPQPRHARHRARSSSGTPAAAARAMADGDRTLLAKALRPFILRRTKAQVVKDLPEKTEQTLHCDMEPAAAPALRGAAGPLPPGPPPQGLRPS